MGHHVPAVPPPIILPSPKTEKPRWRPRLRAKTPGADDASGPQAPHEGDAVFAAGGPLDEKPGRGPASGRGKAALGPPRRGGLTAQALTDETLRTLLIEQEDSLNRSG